MDVLKSCEYNMDIGCVELRFADGDMISIDTAAVETAVNADTWQQSELDWLIYNRPWEYAGLVLHGDIEDYIKGRCEHQLFD